MMKILDLCVPLRRMAPGNFPLEANQGEAKCREVLVVRLRSWQRFATTAAVASLVLFGTAGGVQAQRFEHPVNRSAAAILPANLITGPHHKIRDAVVSYGYMHYFTVDSKFGVFKATGDGALRKLVTEINAIAELRKIKQSDAFVGAIKQSGTAAFRLGKDLITNPVDTLSGIPNGVFRIFENIAGSVTSKRDPSEDSRLEQMLFVSSWKRNYAAQLGVDVYSSNKVLQEELNSVGWAAAIGGLTVSAATMGATATGVVVMKQMRFMDAVRNSLKDEPPARLRLINEKKLAAMGISSQLTREFLDHPQYTPRHDTIIVANLERMRGARGREVYLRRVLVAHDEVAANFFMNVAQTLRGYNDTVSPINEITLVNGFIVARANNGAAVIPAPLDHGVWGQRASKVMTSLVSTYRTATSFNGRFKFWITGTFSPLARQQLARLGVDVVENVDSRILILD